MAESVTREQNPDRFQIAVDEKVAGFTQFVQTETHRIFHHTEIGEEFGGQGLAGKVVQQALDQTRADGLRIVPICPFVVKFVSKTDEFNDVVDEPTAEHFDLARAAG